LRPEIALLTCQATLETGIQKSFKPLEFATKLGLNLGIQQDAEEYEASGEMDCYLKIDLLLCFSLISPGSVFFLCLFCSFVCVPSIIHPMFLTQRFYQLLLSFIEEKLEECEALKDVVRRHFVGEQVFETTCETCGAKTLKSETFNKIGLNMEVRANLFVSLFRFFFFFFFFGGLEFFFLFWFLVQF
jgi:hypothetical protein